MKVLDLQCRHGHQFEGWFASEDDFQAQSASDLVECPLCADNTVTKRLSAPRLNLSGHRMKLGSVEPTASTPPTQVSPSETDIQSAWLKMVRHVMGNTENVGDKFAEEARKIHYGESKERNIRGQASRKETEALLDEGISVMPLPIPVGLAEPLQ